MNTETLKIETLKAIKQTPTALNILKAYIKRERDSKEIIIKDLMYAFRRIGIDVDDNEAMSLFKELEASGVGVIINGRGKGKKKTHTRFKANYSLKDVSNAILNPDNADEIRQMVEKDDKEDDERPRFDRSRYMKERWAKKIKQPDSTMEVLLKLQNELETLKQRIAS